MPRYVTVSCETREDIIRQFTISQGQSIDLMHAGNKFKNNDIDKIYLKKKNKTHLKPIYIGNRIEEIRRKIKTRG